MWSFIQALQLSWYSKNARHGDMGVFGKAIHMSVVDLNIFKLTLCGKTGWYLQKS